VQVGAPSSWQGARMTARRHPSAVRPRTVWTPLGVALAVVLFLATVGSLGVGFGVI
jgi:hypothetical protein